MSHQALSVHCHATACDVDTMKNLNPEKNKNLTISPLLLNLTDANIVYLC